MEMRKRFESLQSVMLEMLDLDPANAWYWVTEAQRRVLQTLISPDANN